MRKIFLVAIVFSVGAMALIASVNLAEAQKKRFVTIGTGVSGGTYYIVGAGIAKLITEYVPGMKATAQGTGGAVENLKLVGTKKLTLACTAPEVTSFAYRGERMFKERYEGLRWLMGGYSHELHIMVLAESSIKSIKDLKGKRVGVGAPGSGTAGAAIFILEAYGLKQDIDYKPEWISYAEMIGGFKDGTIDAAFISAPAPLAIITDLTRTKAIRFLPLSREVQLTLESKFIFPPATIGKGTYKGLDEDVPTSGPLMNLVTHKDVDIETIYAITKVIIEHNKELGEIHPAGKQLTLGNALRGLCIPVHPGAEKYYREKGVLK
jgi:TRAP transporter TAXI family solute receptor